MEKKLTYISILLLSLAFLSFQWPVTKVMVTSSFCESRADHFHDGIDVTSNKDAISPIKTGSLLYYWDKSIFPLENYPGGGNYSILKHKNNLYSIYMHLRDGIPVKSLYNNNDIIGYIDNTGHSYARHLHFSILNINEKASVNPFTLMPRYDDHKKPLINQLFLRIKNKYFLIKDRAKIRLTQHYPLLIDITDRAKGRERLGIHKLTVNVNNKPTLDVVFNKLYFTNNDLLVKKKSFLDLFDEKGYYKVHPISYINGTNFISIKAIDYAGNITEKNFEIFVNLDLK